MKMEMETGEQKAEFELPGFRFHPTEQELLGFYLKKMVQGKLQSFNYIRILDLYRYDPWDLPSLGRSGEREIFFFVPRDKKCQNGGRPSRITASGYWKATGSDRHVRDDHGKSLGLKKTLVFYRGRAPRGLKTDWVMNEYRMPDSIDKPRKEVVLCRIYRKATPLKWLEQRAVSQEEDADVQSQDTLLSPRPKKAKVKQSCNLTKQAEPSSGGASSLEDNTAQYSDITSSHGCSCPLDSDLNSIMESTVYGGFIDPVFQVFSDDGKRSIEGFSSFMALVNSTSSFDCCAFDSVFPIAEETAKVQVPKLSLDFQASNGYRNSQEKNPWTDLWSPSSLLSTPNNNDQSIL